MVYSGPISPHLSGSPESNARSRPMAITGILFDKDGTLLDYAATWGPLNHRAALAVADGDQDLAMRLLAAAGHDPATGRVRSGSVLAAGTNAEIAALWHRTLAADRRTAADLLAVIDQTFDSNSALTATPVTDLAALMGALKRRGLALGVATSDSEAGLHHTLGRMAILDLLDFAAGYDSGFGVKPEPGMVHGFMARTGLVAGDIMVVGDNPHDMAMGRAAGCGALVGVLTGTSTRDDLAGLADHVLADITELEGLLDRLA